MSTIELSHDDIIIDHVCLESYPCQHYVKCKKLNINQTMSWTDIVKLFKDHKLNPPDNHTFHYGNMIVDEN